jgi:hypothetical protein
VGLVFLEKGEFEYLGLGRDTWRRKLGGMLLELMLKVFEGFLNGFFGNLG